MGHILRSRPATLDDRSRPAEHFSDLTHFKVRTSAPDGRTPPEDGTPVWRCRALQRVEMKRGHWPKHSTQSHRSLLLSPWDACPYIKMWFGALTEHSEERLDERDWVYSANHSPTVCLLQYYIHSCWKVCVCVYVLYVWVKGAHKIPSSLEGSRG